MQLDADYVWKETTLSNLNNPCIQFVNKPVTIYQFIDPFCYQSWKLQLIMKKLTVKYGLFFTTRPVICHPLTQLNQSSVSNAFSQWHYYLLSLGIKAASLQGNRAGKKFLHYLQE